MVGIQATGHRTLGQWDVTIRMGKRAERYCRVGWGECGGGTRDKKIMGGERGK